MQLWRESPQWTESAIAEYYLNISMSSNLFITLDGVSVRLRDRLYLQNTSWRINSDEHWAVLGPNGAGKSTLVKCLFGAVPVVRGKITLHFAETNKSSPVAASSQIGYVSSELHRSVFENEELKDSFRDFSGDTDDITTMREMIIEGFPADQRNDSAFEERLIRTCKRLEVDELLARNIKSLSNGEMSRALIVKALIGQPSLLILDEPYEGLDRPSRQALSKRIDELMHSRMRVVLVTHRLEEIVPGITHVLFLKSGRVAGAGRKSNMLKQDKIQALYRIEQPDSRRLANQADRVSELVQRGRRLSGSADAGKIPVLIDMRNVNVSGSGHAALVGFNWVMRAGENWAISGPSGAGKTTIVKLITGENLQAYANEIYLFGSRKGRGESIWSIKKRIGYISSELQKRHPNHQTALDIVCTGYYGTMGLYRRCPAEKVQAAEEWMDILGISDLACEFFGRLSHGQRQLVLIARAMVKAPLLLILDEPCDGLDVANRKKIMDLLDLIGRNSEISLLYVPNQDDEMLSSISHILEIKAGKVIVSASN
jgi:molybdate transport system ATP-binding protein